MKLEFKVNDQITLFVEGANQASLFEELAEMSAIFCAQRECGCCKSPYTFSVKRPQGYVYYELKCTNADCGAVFQFGQLKDVEGGLFPKYKGKDGNWLPNHGWARYTAASSAAGGTRRSEAPANRQEAEFDRF